MEYEFWFTCPTYDDYTVVRECLSRAGEPLIAISDDGDGRIYSVRTTIGQANLIEALLNGAARLHWIDKAWYTLRGADISVGTIWIER